MATEGPGRAQAPTLTSLPRLEDIPTAPGGGYDVERTREAFESFRRHAAQLQAQLRVIQAAGRTANVDPTGHAVRMDALHLIRAAAEFADTLERDAQAASAAQLGRTEEEVTRRQRELQEREAEVERYRQESERQRAEILTAAKSEARDLLAKTNADASQELREAEARAARLLEQARHQATDLTNAARAEVEQTLEWARAQAAAIMGRAQQGAEQFLAAAGLGGPELTKVVEVIVRAAERETEAASAPAAPTRPAAAIAGGPPAPQPAPAQPEAEAPPVTSAPPVSEPEPAEAEDAPAPPPVSFAPPPVAPAAPPVSPQTPEPQAGDVEGEQPAGDDRDAS
jgi:hypothetical protein